VINNSLSLPSVRKSLIKCWIARALIWTWRLFVLKSWWLTLRNKQLLSPTMFTGFRPIRSSLVVNTDVFEVFTGPGFNSTSPDTNKKFLSDVFILCILHLLVPTTLRQLSLTLFDVNNLCFLVPARFVLFFRLAKLCIINWQLFMYYSLYSLRLSKKRLPKFPHICICLLLNYIFSVSCGKQIVKERWFRNRLPNKSLYYTPTFSIFAHQMN
jgi:hypothetical protein